jgi:hypothetical protein
MRRMRLRLREEYVSERNRIAEGIVTKASRSPPWACAHVLAPQNLIKLVTKGGCHKVETRDSPQVRRPSSAAITTFSADPDSQRRAGV